MVQTLIQLIFQGLMHVQHKKPFLVSAHDKTCDISTNKSLRPLSIHDLPPSSASTLLKPDSILLESRSKLAGTLQKISPPTLKMLCFNTLESFHINLNLKFRLSLICTTTKTFRLRTICEVEQAAANNPFARLAINTIK